MQREANLGRSMRNLARKFSRVLVLALALCGTSVESAVGTALIKGESVFRAGGYSRQARLGTLTLKDIGHASKIENINGLIDLAQIENRIDPIQAIRFSYLYQQMDQGHVLLLTCLRHPGCRPDVFYDVVQTSPLHAQIVRRNPTLGFVQANQEVGALTERMMHRYFEGSGWTRIEGEVGRQGIDGLYVKLREGVVRDVLVAESKYNTSSLQPTQVGYQMSPEWVRSKVDALQRKYPQEKLYNNIDRFVDASSYRAVLWQLRMDEDAIHISLTKLIGKGRDVERSHAVPLEGVFGPESSRISLYKPSNRHEAQVVQWFYEELDAVGSVLQ